MRSLWRVGARVSVRLPDSTSRPYYRILTGFQCDRAQWGAIRRDSRSALTRRNSRCKLLLARMLRPSLSLARL